MKTKNKTAETEVNVIDFINGYVDKEQKKQDSLRLMELMQAWSGFEPKMWGPSIIGFGSYHYKYASGHEGDAPLIGFSPRKAEFSLYAYAPTSACDEALENLGKYKKAIACIYFKKLSDLNLEALEKLCGLTIEFLRETYQS